MSVLGHLDFREPDKCFNCFDISPLKREVKTVGGATCPVWVCRKCGKHTEQKRVPYQEMRFMSKEEAVGFIALYGVEEFKKVIGIWCSVPMARKALLAMRSAQEIDVYKPVGDHLDVLEKG